MQSRVYSITTGTNRFGGYIAVYRTDGTAHGGDVHFYPRDSINLIRILRAMVSMGSRFPTWMSEDAYGFRWYLRDVVDQMRAAAAAQEDLAGLGL
jgi:hypothetical protein